MYRDLLRQVEALRLRQLEHGGDVAEVLEPEDVAREALVFGLRRIEGIDLRSFTTRFGYSVDELAKTAIGRFVDAGLLERNADNLRLTREGLLVSDSLWPSILRC